MKLECKLNNRAFRLKHPSKKALLQWYRERNFEEEVILSFEHRNMTPERYFEGIYAAVIEFGKTTAERVRFGAVIAPLAKAPTRLVGQPHAHLALQYPVRATQEFIDIAAKHHLNARFEHGLGLLARICSHMDRSSGFFPFFEPNGHVRGPKRSMLPDEAEKAAKKPEKAEITSKIRGNSFLDNIPISDADWLAKNLQVEVRTRPEVERADYPHVD